MDIGTLNASLPENTESAPDDLLASDSDISNEENESRGFFGRLFSRSRDTQSSSEPEVAVTDVPVEEYSTVKDEPTEPSNTQDEIENNTLVKEADTPSGGIFGRLFGRRSTTEETLSDVATESPQNVVEIEQEDIREPIETATETQLEESDDANEAQSSSGLFGNLFGRRSSSEAEEILSSENSVETDSANKMEVSEPESEVSETGTEQQKPRSNGFFGRIFGGGNSDNDAANVTNEQIAMVEDETNAQPSLTQTAETSIDAANDIYEQGIYEIERKNYGVAAKHFQSAAAQGNLMAQYHLATLYYQGLGKQQDYSQAALWYRRAAEQGNIDAQYSLGNMYLMGEGIPADDQQARYWYNEAAKQGHQSAQHNVDNIDRYSKNNIPITQDIAAEIMGIDDSMTISMDESIDIGISDDQNVIADVMVASASPVPSVSAPSSLAAVDYERGLAYSFGEGVTKDLQTAFEYFKKAADKDYAPAQYKIGVAYAYAEGTVEDKSQAVYWYEKAAMQGHTIAQRNIGIMYENGEGISQDKVKALAWYNILAQSGNVMDIRRRDNLSGEMSSTEISEAETLAINLQNIISETNR